MNANIIYNERQNGIEIRFDFKPEDEIIQLLKSNGFRWSGKQKMWYAKKTNDRIEFANSLNTDESFTSKENKKEKHSYSLWEATRVDEIENNFKKHKIYDTKKIAALVRKHIKPRFPMCKFSIRSDYNSIDISLLESPFNKNSDELNAIVHYVYTYTESYNYDNSDIMCDYFDVNFYGVYEKSIVSCYYEQTEMDEAIRAIADDFQMEKAAWEQAEAIRKKQEHDKRLKQMEIDRRLAEEREKQIKDDMKAIEDNVIVTDFEKPYYILDMKSPGCNKFCNISEAYQEIEDGNFTVRVCQITREVNMSKDLYEKFKNMLMCSFSFLAGKGGTGTIDNRINAMIDYDKMSKEEMETVEMYDSDCVSIYCENELMLVCNPEGYNYARYVLIPDESYTKTDNYTIEQIVTDDEFEANLKVANYLYNISTNIIKNNQLRNDWNDLKFGEWNKCMVNYINGNGIKFNVDIVRAIPGEKMDFKIAMYRLLEETEDIIEQFDNACFVEEQKITLLKLDNIIGSIRAEHLYFRRYECGNKSIKIIVRVPGKHGEYYYNLNKDILIVDGWIETPRELFFEETISQNGVKCERMRFFSFDRNQMDVTLDYIRSMGIKPIINTYKPQFN